MKLETALRGFLRRSAGERRALLRVFLLSLAVEVGLRSLSLRRLTRLLGVRLAPEERAVGESIPSPDETRLVGAAERIFNHWRPGRNCLRRSLVLARLLRRHSPVVQIGVARGTRGELRAHAWVEVDGEPVSPQGGEESFRPIASARTWVELHRRSLKVRRGEACR